MFEECGHREALRLDKGGGAADATVMHARTWLCRDDLERARLLDMSVGLRAAKRRSLALLAGAAAVSVPVYGVKMQMPLVLAAIALVVLERWARALPRPEYALASVWVIAQVAIVASIALANGPRMYMLSILVFPMLVAAPIYPRRVVAVGAVITAVAMIAAGFAFMPHTVATLPPVVLFPVLLLVTITILGSRTLSAEEDSRQAVVLDPLTGLLIAPRCMPGRPSSGLSEPAPMAKRRSSWPISITSR